MFVDALLFTWVDYLLFCSVLGFSVLIGAYFWCCGKKQNSPKEYLHGGRTMQVLPVAASLIASDISGITILGVPSDIYTNGSSYSLCIFSAIIMTLIVTFTFLPVYYKLQVSSSFEYLKLRYNNRICLMASFIFAVNTLMYLPIVIYLPALAFSQVTRTNQFVIIPVVCLICIFYTTIGGIKAVVWTDTLQMVMMVGSLMTIFILGVWIEGGFENIWQTSQKGGRIDFKWSFDPTDRTASFTVIFGFGILWSGYGNNPIFVQRFLAVPTLKQATIISFIYCAGTIFFKAISSFLGLIVYSHYAKCDPLENGDIRKADQILPYYIMDVCSSLPGLPGLFVAGIFCAALSTMSSGLNTMAGTIYEDFVKPNMPADTTEKKASDVMKCIVVVLGLVTMALVFVVHHLGGILQLSYAIGGITAGSILAMFSLGMLCPFINAKGILYGSIAGVVAVAWIMLGAQYYTLIGLIKPKTLESNRKGCPYYRNETITRLVTPYERYSKPSYPYRISFHYYSLIGLIVTTLIAAPISWFTGGRTQKIHPDLLSPLINSFRSKNIQEAVQDCGKELDDMQQNLIIID